MDAIIVRAVVFAKRVSYTSYLIGEHAMGNVMGMMK
jgi:hypothetical protein